MSDIIYDSYISDSLKECERLRRSKGEPIYLKNIQLETKLPVQLEIVVSGYFPEE